jgi:outer membrane protein OmpA-like peptidoglycan-associated protein
MKRLTVLAPLVAIAAFSLRCASGPPPREIAVARLAVEDARNAGADRLAPRDYDAANAHLGVAQSTWNETKDAAAAAHWARLAEGEARTAQYRAEAQKAEEELRRETERRSRGELAVRDAEIAVLQARAKTEAEKRAAEAEIRAALDRRRVQEELTRREEAARESERIRAETEARLAAEQARAQQESAQRTQEERERLNAELEKTRVQLEKTRLAAEEAKKAADEQQRRLEEQSRADQERQAQLQKAREAQQQSEEQLQQTLAQLAQVRSEARGLIVTLPGSIYFEVNKSDVKPAMRTRLTEIAKALAAVANRHILIEGHTDSDGSAGYNLQLSQLRAESVRSVLVSAGVSPDRIETHGYGKTRPIAPNTTAAGKAQNRRVEIVVEGGAGGPVPAQ